MLLCNIIQTKMRSGLLKLYSFRYAPPFLVMNSVTVARTRRQNAHDASTAPLYYYHDRVQHRYKLPLLTRLLMAWIGLGPLHVLQHPFHEYIFCSSPLATCAAFDCVRRYRTNTTVNALKVGCQAPFPACKDPVGQALALSNSSQCRFTCTQLDTAEFPPNKAITNGT